MYWKEAASPIHGEDLSPEEFTNMVKVSQIGHKKKSIQLENRAGLETLGQG